MVEDVFVGLGSNLEQPVKQVNCALKAFEHFPQTSLHAHSSLYMNPPMGPVAQPDFINAVAWLKTTLSPSQLLAELKAQELRQGRAPTVHWGPRTLDCDILFFGERVEQTPTLEIPHPGVMLRSFTLIPLEEICPEFELPNGQPIGQVITSAMRAELRIYEEVVV